METFGRITDGDAVDLAMEELRKDGLERIDAAGFKTVTPGVTRGAVILPRDVLRAMEEHLTVAPAHSGHYIDVVAFFMEKYPGLSLVGLFEPHFHDSLPPEARVYGVPFEWYEKHGVEKFGFHGASHHFVRDRMRDLAPMRRHRRLHAPLFKRAARSLLRRALPGACVQRWPQRGIGDGR